MIIDLSNLPIRADGEPADFIVGKVHNGLVIYAQVGEAECFGDNPQDALNLAIKAFNEKETRND